jgi:NAD(P)H dehydrogenase (quinone)
MQIQVVHCHPLVDSFGHALFRTTVEALQDGGHEVVTTDLYREGFQPAMTERERRTYMDNDYDGRDVADYIAILKRVEGIVFCFPHWWFAMPAVLKGYVDRVWAPGAAFVYDKQDNHLVPNLRHIRLFGGVTTYGSPWWIVRVFAGDPGRKVMMRGLKPLCASTVRTFWLAQYDMDHATPACRRAFLEKVRSRVMRVGRSIPSD